MDAGNFVRDARDIVTQAKELIGLMIQPVKEQTGVLGDYVEEIITRVREKYPEAISLMRDLTYGDEDLGLDIYVAREEVQEVRHYAHEVAFNATLGTEWLILPSVASLEFCPVKA